MLGELSSRICEVALMATSPRLVDNNCNIKSISFVVTHGSAHHASLDASLMRSITYHADAECFPA